jgi:hypothetical protein
VGASWPVRAGGEYGAAFDAGASAVRELSGAFRSGS